MARFNDDVDDLAERRRELRTLDVPLRLPTLPVPSLLERDPSVIASAAVRTKNEVTVINRRIVNAQDPGRGSDLIDEPEPAISEARPSPQAAGARPLRVAVSAKAIAADRRQKLSSHEPKNINGTAAVVVPRAEGRFAFLLPENVLPCVQRVTRREVLFAKNKAFGSHRRKRRTFNSNIGCD